MSWIAWRTAAGVAALGLATGCEHSAITGTSLQLLDASRSEAPVGEVPTCGGLPATIWVGMDPKLLPRGASIEELEEDHELIAESEHEEDEDHARYQITGTNGPDVIVGSSAPDRIYAGSGADIVCSRQAADRVWAGNGDDRVYAGPGADHVYGERGDDYLEGGPGGDLLWGGQGDDELHGGSGKDYLYGNTGDDALFGEKSPDVLVDDQGVNVLDPGPQECEGGEGGEGDEGDDHEEGGDCSGGGEHIL